MGFARCGTQMVVHAAFATKLLPPKSVPHKAKATIARVASALANSL
jgi:hypothetical protein